VGNPTCESVGVRSSEVRASAAIKLLESEVDLLTEDEMLENPGLPELRITLQCVVGDQSDVDGAIAYSIEVRVNQAAKMVRDEQVTLIPEDFRIRIGMMNPMFMPRIRDNLLKSFESDKVFRFLHVPVQSGSNEVLNNMKRGHTVETFKDVVRKFRTKFGR